MIGVFDSGLGGLGALFTLHSLLPQEDIVYLADTAHLPYGDKSPAELKRYTAAAIDHVAALGASHLLVACGTVSSTVLDACAAHSPLPLFGVVGSAAAYAAAHSTGGRIGIIGTAATARAGAFAHELRRLRSDIRTLSLACPLFVSLAEYGFTDPNDPVAHAAAQHYLSPLRNAGIDTLILGCTHFSLLSHAIADALPSVHLVDCGRHAAVTLCDALPKQRKKENGRILIHTTADPDGFLHRASSMFGKSTFSCVRRVRL